MTGIGIFPMSLLLTEIHQIEKQGISPHELLYGWTPRTPMLELMAQEESTENLYGTGKKD